MNNNKSNNGRPRKLELKPKTGHRISCGKASIALTEENKRVIKINTILRLNHELGNHPIDERVFEVMNDNDLEQLHSTLQTQRQVMYN